MKCQNNNEKEKEKDFTKYSLKLNCINIVEFNFIDERTNVWGWIEKKTRESCVEYINMYNISLFGLNMEVYIAFRTVNKCY